MFRNQPPYYLLLIALFLIFPTINGQELDDFESYLNVEVENINPVYKPVLSIGTGILSYYGDIRNNYKTPTLGDLGYVVNVSAYLDDYRYYRGNLFFMMGSLSGNQRDYSSLSRNFNFKTNINVFGITIDYDFDHLIKDKKKKIHPFVAIGIENIIYNSKTDSLDASNNKYNYLPDGKIVSQSNGMITHRDYKVDTDLKLVKGGANFIIATPVEAGIDFQVSYRMMLRLATSIHYNIGSSGDNIDQINETTEKDFPALKGLNQVKGNDFFTYTYFRLHLDLFSEDKTISYQKMFEEVDFDYAMFDDQDNDFIPDIKDKCWDTPFGLEVDSLGCPFDGDNDGVPDYLDKEENTPTGSFVNSDGVSLSEDELIALLDNSDAVLRKEIELYIRDKSSYARYYRTNIEIPKKFSFLDQNTDGYISFDEMLDAIDMYFDFDAELSNDDIYELNNLFFSQ